MAESTEKKLWIVIGAKVDGIEKSLKDLNGEIGKAERDWKKSFGNIGTELKNVGMQIGAMGAGITASMGLMVKSAIEEEININRLSTTLKNVGVSYDEVNESLEAVIATTQRKTGVADDQQRDILNRLILTTGDYRASLELLPTVLDLAAAGEMDATTAATYLGKAHNELAAGAEEVSVKFGQASLKFSSMADIQDRVKGSAEALANPLEVLKASIGDIGESLGAILIPLLKVVVNKLVDDVIPKVQEWIAVHPELTRFLVIATTAVGLLMTAMGGLLFVMGQLLTTINLKVIGLVLHAAKTVIVTTVTKAWTAAQWLLNIALDANPIGLFVIAVGIMAAEVWGIITLINNFRLEFLQAYKSIVDFANMITLGMVPALQSASTWLQNEIDKTIASKAATEAKTVATDTNSVAVTNNKVALDNHTASVNTNKTAVDNHTASVNAANEAVKTSSEETEKLRDKLQKLADAYAYSQTTAGKMGITLNDVTNYLYSQGYTVEQVMAIYQEFGEDANAIVNGLGILWRDLEKTSQSATATMKANVSEMQASLDKLNASIPGGVSMTNHGIVSNTQLEAERDGTSEFVYVPGVGYVPRTSSESDPWANYGGEEAKSEAEQAYAAYLSGGDTGGGSSESSPEVDTESGYAGYYAEGGIAVTPQVAHIAENGPEIILPMDKLKSILSGQSGRTVNTFVYLDGKLIGKSKSLMQAMVDNITVYTGARI